MCHVFHFFVHFNAIWVVGGNNFAIEYNWGVNCAFGKFGGEIEQRVIVKGDKV